MINPWSAKTVILLTSIAMVVIRAPHGKRSSAVPVAKNFRGTLETVLLTIAWIAFFVPLLWVMTPALAFADYPLKLAPFIGGIILLAIGLWLFHRAHADLGTNWSITLQVREGHELITRGVYSWVRHPMYLALLIYSVGQLLAVSNWVAGPSYFVAMVLLVLLRMGPEERMMREQFGRDFESYAATSWRLLPGVW